MNWSSQWKPYVPVAKRRKQAEAEAKKLQTKGGQPLKPVRIVGTKIVTTFWGKAWCENLEKYSDFSNRLPRGRSYARNGSVIHLEITKGKIEAMVCGSSLYKIKIEIDTLNAKKWKAICNECSGSVHSLLDLMQGKLNPAILSKLTDKDSGMFPSPKEIKLDCSCPDWSDFCKHRAAVMYCIGHRLDTEPELLFVLRGVDQSDLIGQALGASSSAFDSGAGSLESDDLGALFGIELANNSAPSPTTRRSASKVNKTTPVEKAPAKKAPAKKASAKKVPVKKAPVKKANVKKGATPKLATKRSGKLDSTNSALKAAFDFVTKGTASG